MFHKLEHDQFRMFETSQRMRKDYAMLYSAIAIDVNVFGRIAVEMQPRCPTQFFQGENVRGGHFGRLRYVTIEVHGNCVALTVRPTGLPALGVRRE